MFKNIIIFLAGCGVGTFVGYKVFQKKYSVTLLEPEETESDENPETKKPEKPNSVKTNTLKIDINEYAKKLKDKEYVNYSSMSKSNNESSITPVEVNEEDIPENLPVVEKPEIVTENDWEDYDDIIDSYFILYSDRYLTDMHGGLVDLSLVGEDNIDTMLSGNTMDERGNPKDDFLIRNHEHGCIYQVSLDAGTFYEPSPEDE